MIGLVNSPERVFVRDRAFRLFLRKEEIAGIVGRVAEEINRDYQGKSPLFLGILNGAFIFASDLMRQINIPAEISFVKYTSYKGMKSTRKMNRLIGLNENIRGREVIILEDIVDTGNTMARLIEDLRKYSPAGIRIACFCFKKVAFRETFRIDYCGLEIPDLFVVGYGLDYDGNGRNYPDIYQQEL